MRLSTIAAAMVFIMLYDAAIAGNFSFSCDIGNVTRNSTGPMFPNGNSYAYEVLISIEGKKETIEAKEFYDMKNDNVFLRVHYPVDGKWVSEMIHHDYEYNQTFHFHPESNTCNVSDLIPDQTYSLFGMGIEDGFKNPEFVFRWNGSYNYTEAEPATVNGIPATMQSTCLTFNNDTIKYDVDIYFSDDDWNMKSNYSIPLMLVLKVNQTKDDGDTFETETYTYAFSAYSVGPNIHQQQLLSSLIPRDIVCEDRKDIVSFPNTSNNFEAVFEIILEDSKKIFTSKHYYDYDEKLSRFDFLAPKPAPNKSTTFVYHHEYSIIHDFHAGIEYIIDKELGNCTMNPITDANMWDFFDVGKDPAGYFQMKNYVDITKKRNMTYTGRHASPHNGLEFHSWTGIVPLIIVIKNVTHEVYETYTFTTSDWSSGDISPVLFSSVTKTKSTYENGTVTHTNMTIHYSGLKPLKHTTHEFEVGMCHRDNARKSIVLKFSKDYNQYIGPYSTQIDVAVQKAVVDAAVIPKIRVSTYISKEIGVDGTSDSADEKLFFTVTLYDRLNFHGNTSEYTPGINLTTAVQNLKKVVKNNELKITFNPQKGDPVTMIAYPGYFVERSSLYAPPTPEPAKQSTGLAAGPVAGIAIGMVVVGFIIGAMVVHFRYKRGNHQFAYGIQD